MHWLEIYYYSITSNGFPADQASMLSLLDEYEHQRFERYRFDDSRWTFATARWIAKTQLAKHLGLAVPEALRFSYNDNGKPFLQNHDQLHFSISHTKSGIAIAVSNRACGIDLEGQVQRGEPWLDAKPFLNDHAAGHIDALDEVREKIRCFSRYWTMMEAKVKWQGSTLFGIKEQFARDLPALLSDGRYKDATAAYFTGSSPQQEQLSVCVECIPESVDVYAFHADNIKSPWLKNEAWLAELFTLGVKCREPS